MNTQLTGQHFVVRSNSDTTLSLSGDPEGYFLELFVSQATNGEPPKLSLEGLASGTTKVNVKIELDGVVIGTKEASVQYVTHSWQLIEELPVDKGMLAAQLSDQNGVPLDNVAVHLIGLHESIPKGEISNSSDTKLLAGNGDRIIPTRSFGLIEKPPLFILDPIINDYVGRGFQFNSVTVREEGKDHEITASLEDYQDGVASYNRIIDDESEGRVSANDRQLRKKIKNGIKKNIARKFKSSRIDPKSVQIKRGVHLDTKSQSLIVTLPLNAKSKFGGAPNKDYPEIDLKDYYGQSRVGIYFSERIRFRSAGLVRGEPFYSLALDAGEEVELRQSSETIRNVTAEETLDRESEYTNTLSSTWSTDVSSAFNTTQSENSGWNIGNEIGFSGVPNVPVNIGVSGGYSASSAAQNTADFAIQTAFELSKVAVARLRAQHRTRMEVQEKNSIGSSSVRVLNNRGAVRPRRVDFYKMYRKEMATYERHNAHMCLRLCVNDPGKTVRDSFMSSLDGIDPNNDDHYVSVPTPESAKTSILKVTFKAGVTIERGVEPFVDGYSSENVSINLKDDQDDPIPSNYLLVGSPRVRMTKMKQFFRPLNLLEDLSEETTYTSANQSSVAIHTGIEVLHPFETDETLSDPSSTANDIKWLVKPQSGAATGAAMLGITYRNWVNLLGTVQSNITEIELEIESEWATPSEELEALETERDEIRQELQQNLSVDSVLEYRDIARQDYLSEVLARAMNENLHINNVFSPISPKDIPEIFDLASAYVENAPYWATADATQKYSDLRNRLLEMKLPMPISQVLIPELVASQAVLYLPIHHGAEKDVISLLNDYSESRVDGMVAEFNNYYQTEFAPTSAASSLPLYEDVDSPVPVSTTALGHAQWQSEWEKPQRTYSVLAQWADYVPTDGVDSETELSPTSRADEALLMRLSRDPEATI